MADELWERVLGDQPIAATAIHDGHELREEVAVLSALSDAERLREEDPYTGRWAAVAATRLIPRRSRFEVDLNRPREKAVYAVPGDAWGLDLWKRSPPPALLARSLEQYDAFYSEISAVLSGLVDRFGAAVLLDLHSYNHRRDGPGGAQADPAANPEVNVGTGTLDRTRWGALADRFIADLRAFDFGGRALDVRENVRFRGGNLSRFVHETFAGRACVLAVEFKKFFMDEWTGKLVEETYARIAPSLQSTLPGLRAELERVVAGKA